MSTRRFGRYSVETSSEDKVLFPDAGITKGQLIDYYEAVADTMLRHLRDRALTLHRFPDGIDADGFYQQQAGDYFPDWITRKTLSKEGGEVAHVVCDKAATLVYLANQACITPHCWLSRIDEPDQPDRIVIDLDPADDDFGKVREAARLVSEAFDDLGLAVFLQVTGSRGIHVVAPIRRGPGFDDVRKRVREIADRLADEHADRLTVEQRKNKRGKRIYLDTSRLAYGQTMVAPYAVRAKPGAPVATPIKREELDDKDLSPRRWTIDTVLDRLDAEGDLWDGIGRAARDLDIE
jgi:bifunctional non-homologous end joining protein LigD